MINASKWREEWYLGLSTKAKYDQGALYLNFLKCENLELCVLSVLLISWDAVVEMVPLFIYTLFWFAFLCCHERNPTSRQIP